MQTHHLLFAAVVVIVIFLANMAPWGQSQQLREEQSTERYNTRRGLAGKAGQVAEYSFYQAGSGSFTETSDVTAIVVNESLNQQNVETEQDKLTSIQDLINTMTKEKKNRNQDGSDHLTAIVHVGPMKTGSSAIQHALSTSPNELLLDTYEYGNRLFTGHANKFFMCFDDDSLLNDPTNNPCDVSVLREITQQVSLQRHHNIILSAEGFWRPQTDLNRMKEYLISSGWHNVVIVMFYRRYYEWLLSFHNQGNKGKAIEQRQSFVDKVLHEMCNDYGDDWALQYVVGEYNRYKEHFDVIKLYNMHSIPNGDVREALMCDAMKPNEFNTCDKLHKMQQTDEHEVNSHHSLVYDALAYYAKKMNLWSERENLTFDNVIQLVKHHQEQVLQLDENDFDSGVTCPDDDQLEWLLEKSLTAEELLFPEYFETQGKEEIIETFNATKRKFCHVDATTVLLNSKEWRDFFESL